MSKIDKLKEKITHIYFNDYNVLPKYMEAIEELRPYEEVAEWIVENRHKYLTGKLYPLGIEGKIQQIRSKQ